MNDELRLRLENEALREENARLRQSARELVELRAELPSMLRSAQEAAI